MRKPGNFSMQRKRLTKETPKGDVIVCSLWRHKEMGRNDPSPSFRRSNNPDNNDPCINSNVQVKLFLIDSEGYGESYADEAQAIEMCAA